MAGYSKMCVECGGLLSKLGKHVDHVLPLAKGGPHSTKNLQLLCPPCNRSKSDKLPEEFMRERGFLC
jgi:5-methylcytosine-specific restriction endonuclease McrA